MRKVDREVSPYGTNRTTVIPTSERIRVLYMKCPAPSSLTSILRRLSTGGWPRVQRAVRDHILRKLRLVLLLAFEAREGPHCAAEKTFNLAGQASVIMRRQTINSI